MSRSERKGSTPGGRERSFFLTVRVGVSGERINACLTRLRDLGLVELKRKRLRIPHVEAMAGFESRSRPKADGRPRASVPRGD